MKHKFLQVVMPDHSVWQINVNEIAEDRADYYSEFKDADYDEIFNETLEDEETLFDWAENNMNWSAVQPKAIKIKDGKVDYEEGWTNGYKTIIAES